MAGSKDFLPTRVTFAPAASYRVATSIGDVLMAISSDYPRPITVNGYICRNCDDVSDAKKFIDPSKPKAGIGAIDATEERAVSFGGGLSFRNAPSDVHSRPAVTGAGQRYDKVA
jgi:hypothetical protein